MSLSVEDYEVPPEWISLLRGLRNGLIILVLGASDTGKTTLIRFLINGLVREGRRVAFIDSDIGQSSIGVPTTIASSLISSSRNLESPGLHSLFFIGSTSPPGNLLQMAVGLRKTVDLVSHSKPDLVVIDTTGFISGGAAYELKYQKVSLIQPTHIVAIERDRELEPLLRAVSYSFKGLRISRLNPVSSVRSRSLDERQANRERMFGEYFSSARRLQIKLAQVSLRRGPFGCGIPVSELRLYELSRASGLELLYGEEGDEEAVFVSRFMGRNPSSLSRIQGFLKRRFVKVINRGELEGAVIGLGSGDKGGFVLGLGIVLGLEEGRISVLTPLRDSSKIGVITFGSLKLSPSGKETGRLAFY